VGFWELYEILLKTYGKQNWWPAETPFEVCVGAILTQNTSWKNVERAIARLKKANLLCPERIVSASDGEIQECIRPAGFFRQKTAYLKEFSKFLVDVGGLESLKSKDVSQLRNVLTSVRGIGKETADSIILYALEKPTFVVDAYTKRLFVRLNLIGESSKYDEIKFAVESQIPPTEENVEVYKEFHALIVVHGKSFCRKSPVCFKCPLEGMCYNSQNPTSERLKNGKV